MIALILQCFLIVTIRPSSCLILCVLPNSFEYRNVKQLAINVFLVGLTHWGRVTHVCVGNLTIIGPGNGLSPGRRQTIIWTNAGRLLIGPWGTNFSEILIGTQKFSFKKMHLKMSSAKCRPFCLGLNVLRETDWAKYGVNTRIDCCSP